jgi:prepilin-type N-terminal cleavage/methylation domain-containing protein
MGLPVGGVARLSAPQWRDLGEHVVMRRKGFTIIELLVVIAIIVILAAILFPAFAGVRRAANNAACLSNLKQIGMSVSMYAQDYDETFPTACTQADRVVGKAQPNLPNTPTPYLWEVMTPYIKNAFIWRCPGDVGFTAAGGRIDFRPSAFDKTGSSYTYNTDLVWQFTGDPTSDPWETIGYWAPMTVASIQHPTETFVVAEPAGHWHNSTLAPIAALRNASNDTRNTYHYNQVCVDGHAKSFPLSQIQVLWSRTRDQF